MAVNLDKPQRWKSDIAASVDFYNDWFMTFAPQTYRTTRLTTTEQVKHALAVTDQLTDISPQTLAKNPAILAILRMSTAPPIARDRLIGLADVSANLVINMEKKSRLPPRTPAEQAIVELAKVGAVIHKLVDEDIFPWIVSDHPPTEAAVHRAATVVADRLCGAVAEPVIRNAQEQRQLAAIKSWLTHRGYRLVEGIRFDALSAGQFAFRSNIPVTQRRRGQVNQVNIPVDVVVQPHHAQHAEFPLLIEAKSAGDFTNTNKRRKEEATKVAQLRATYSDAVRFVLFLCGYFDSGYLGYEAAEGIDWVWEHRIDDLAEFGL